MATSTRHLTLLIFLLATCQASLRSAITPFIPELMARYGVGYTEMGVLFSALLVANSSLQLPLGMAADRFPPGRLLGVSLLILAGAGLAFLGARTLTAAMWARVVMGAASAAVFPAAAHLAYQQMPPERRGAAMSSYESGIAFAMFLVLGFLPALAGGIGFDLVQGLLVVLTAAVAVLVLRLFAPAPSAAVPTGATTPAGAPGGDAAAGYAQYGVLRRVTFLILMAGCMFLLQGVVISWLPTYLRDGLGFTPRGAGLLMAITTGTYFPLAPVVGRLCDRLPRRLAVATVGNLLLAVAFALLLASGTGPGTGSGLLWPLLVALLLLGPGQALGIVPMLLILPTLFGRTRTGFTASLMVASGQGGVVLAAVAGGYLLDRTGTFAAIWGLCIGVLTLRTAAQFLVREQPAAAGKGVSPPSPPTSDRPPS